jgi:type IV pilus assembly protein PilX
MKNNLDKGALFHRVSFNTSKSQHGFAMTTAIIFLFALLLLGIASIKNNVMQERMVGNSKDENIAFQAAEACLRDAETDVSLNLLANSPFVSACTNGLCLPASLQGQSTPVWNSVNWSDASVTRLYGQYTGATALTGVAAQPVYIVERLSSVNASAGESIGMGIQPIAIGQAYRITVLATGARLETKVMLQSMYSER